MALYIRDSEWWGAPDSEMVLSEGHKEVTTFTGTFLVTLPNTALLATSTAKAIFSFETLKATFT